MMSDVIIFGGTTEGRLLAEACAEQGIQAVVCVVSDYGKQMLPESPFLTISRRAMMEEEMVSLIHDEAPQVVLDATHPYAAVVTDHVIGACKSAGVKYVRISREETVGFADGGSYQEIDRGLDRRIDRGLDRRIVQGVNRRIDQGVNRRIDPGVNRRIDQGLDLGQQVHPGLNQPIVEETAQVHWVETVEAAVEYLAAVSGTVLVTTGSKELETYTKLPDYTERLYVRVLPGSENLAVCESFGICGKHVIGMQGPFSKEMNLAMLRHTGAKYLVTKEAGAAGGFMEKIEAAMECGATSIVIGRPKKPEGLTLDEGMEILRELSGKPREMTLNLIGIGMGGTGQLTQEAVEILRQSDVVLGAERMLKSIEAIVTNIRKEPFYLSRDVIRWLDQHDGYRRVSVVYSGDTGFYSGARTLLEDWKNRVREHKTEPNWNVRVCPGISTVSYLCAKLQTSWDDAYLASAHGRSQDAVKLLKIHDKIFMLLGGENAVGNLCRRLDENGYSNVSVSVGERLSYPNERIVTGKASELKELVFDGLAAVLIQKM